MAEVAIRFMAFAALTLCMAGDQSFRAQCDALKVDTALVIHSEEIDEYPVWSPDSGSLAARLGEQWKVIRLDDLKLVPGMWHGSPVGVAKDSELLPIPQNEVAHWQAQSAHSERALRVPTGECIRFAHKDLATSLELTDTKGETRVLWRTNLENCRAISLSPDHRYLAYICELNGLVVSDVHKLLAQQGEETTESDNCSDDQNHVYIYKIILPEGFLGWVRVDFGVDSAPSLGDERAVIRVDKTGRSRNSSAMMAGDPAMVKYEFWYQTRHGLRPVPSDLVSQELNAGGLTARADDYKTPVKPLAWYFLVAPKSYRVQHPISDYADGKKPLPTPGRLN